jgi:predicted amidophosphoribosyltransferase
MFALGIYEQLARRGLLDFDAIIPVPLSPDKIERKELNRTHEMAQHLALLLGNVPVVPGLRLKEPISKRSLQSTERLGPSAFEKRYDALLLSDGGVLAGIGAKILLLDDVSTKGSTLSVCAARLKSFDDSFQITAVVGAQMLIAEAVRDPNTLITSPTSADGIPDVV